VLLRWPACWRGVGRPRRAAPQGPCLVGRPQRAAHGLFGLPAHPPRALRPQAQPGDGCAEDDMASSSLPELRDAASGWSSRAARPLSTLSTGSPRAGQLGDLGPPSPGTAPCGPAGLHTHQARLAGAQGRPGASRYAPRRAVSLGGLGPGSLAARVGRAAGVPAAVMEATAAAAAAWPAPVAVPASGSGSSSSSSTSGTAGRGAAQQQGQPPAGSPACPGSPLAIAATFGEHSVYVDDSSSSSSSSSDGEWQEDGRTESDAAAGGCGSAAAAGDDSGEDGAWA
jgi:hypothetical protein